ncbi:hypothetical protein HAX54_039334 [Datura stramonium]|uniref:Uncharacterized protein n=1 Tax=Datura stramonium TaxID=4076 RepID=A0ABS8VL78_DATST|nr:hypothetical protein [Datura stramonium]
MVGKPRRLTERTRISAGMSNLMVDSTLLNQPVSTLEQSGYSILPLEALTYPLRPDPRFLNLLHIVLHGIGSHTLIDSYCLYAVVLNSRWDSTPIVPAGVIQAERCKMALADMHFDQCFSSPISRAKTTAEIIWQGKEEPLMVYTLLRNCEGKTVNMERNFSIDTRRALFGCDTQIYFTCIDLHSSWTRTRTVSFSGYK